jgi:hypothetical protein
MERARVSTEGAPQRSSVEDEEKTGQVVMPEIAARPAGRASERGSDTGRGPGRWQSTGRKQWNTPPARRGCFGQGLPPTASDQKRTITVRCALAASRHESNIPDGAVKAWCRTPVQPPWPS